MVQDNEISRYRAQAYISIGRSDRKDVHILERCYIVFSWLTVLAQPTYLLLDLLKVSRFRDSLQQGNLLGSCRFRDAKNDFEEFFKIIVNIFDGSSFVVKRLVYPDAALGT